MLELFPLVLIFIIIIFLNSKFIKLNGEATTICGVLTSIGVYLCLIPVIVYLSGNKDLLEISFSSIKSDERSYITAYASICTFLLFLIIGYSNKIKMNYCLDNEKLLHLSKFLGTLSLFVGLISFIIYAQSFGGIIELIINAEFLRSFSTEKAAVANGWTYILVVPARLITVSPYLILLSKNAYKKRNTYLLFFILSLVGSILFYLSDAGKTGVLIFGMSFFVPIISYMFKHKWIITIIVACICLEIVTYLDALFVYIATGDFLIEDGQSNIAYLSQFSYPFENVLNLENISHQSGFRYGQDFITGILNIIPGINFEPSYVPTSQYYGGADWKITGGVPNDAITFGYLQFGLLGVAVVAYILGFVCSRIDKCMRLLKNTFVNEVIKCTLIIMYFQLFVSADIITITRNKFGLVLLTLVVIMSCQKVVRKRILIKTEDAILANQNK